MVPRVIIFVVLLIFALAPGALSAQEKEKDPETEYLGKERWAYKTNALEWLLTIPNFGVEYDLSKSVYNRMTIGLSAKYNWNTTHNYAAPMVFNVTEIRPEFRYYWRQTQKPPKSPDDTAKVGFGKWLRDNVFTTDRKNPKDWRAYYIGGYLNGGTYSFKLGKEGRQGQMYGIGVTFGYGIPLYKYERCAIDLDLGMSLGLALTRYDAYAHNPDGNYYTVLPEKSRGGLYMVPYPVISELRVAFVFRKKSIEDKYIRVDQDKLREKMDRRDAREMRRDSIRLQKSLDREQADAVKSASEESADLQSGHEVPDMQPARPDGRKGEPEVKEASSAKAGKARKEDRPAKPEKVKKGTGSKIFQKKTSVKEEDGQ